MLECEEAADTVGDDYRLQTALDGFCTDLPALHCVFEEGPLRQLLAFGARPTGSHTVHFHTGAWLCFETARRKLHAFHCAGAGASLSLETLSALADIADASCSPVLPVSAMLEVHHVRHGWLVAETVQALDELLSGCFAGAATTAPFKLVGHESALLADEPAEPADALLAAFVSAYPEHDEPHQRQTAWPILHRRTRPLVEAFLARLLPLGVQACRELFAYRIGAYNALADAGPRIALYRAQAARAIPAIGALLVQSAATRELPLRMAIDRRLPLIPAAAAAYGVSPETIRFLAGRSLGELGLAVPDVEDLWMRSPEYVLAALASLAPEHRPACPADWSAFHELIAPLRRWHDEMPGAISDFLKAAAKAGFRDSLETVRRKFGGAEALGDFDEYLDCLEAALRRTRRLSAEQSRRLRRAYALRSGLRRLASEAHRWRQSVARETTRSISQIEQASGRATLTLPVPMPQTLHGHRIVFLGSGALMVAESLRMSHCVETLYPAAVLGKRLAFSIRDANDISLATFDISLRAGPDGYRTHLNEISARQNRPAPPEAIDIADDFRRAVDRNLAGREKEVRAWLEHCGARRVRTLERDRARVAKAAERTAIKPFLSRLKDFPVS